MASSKEDIIEQVEALLLSIKLARPEVLIPIASIIVKVKANSSKDDTHAAIHYSIQAIEGYHKGDELIGDITANEALEEIREIQFTVLSYFMGAPKEVIKAFTKDTLGIKSYASGRPSPPNNGEIRDILERTLTGQSTFESGKLIADKLHQWLALLHEDRSTLVDRVSIVIIFLSLEHNLEMKGDMVGKKHIIQMLAASIKSKYNTKSKAKILLEGYAVATLTPDELIILEERGIFDAIRTSNALKKAIYCYDDIQHQAIQKLFIQPEQELPDFWLCPISYVPLRNAVKNSAGRTYSREAIESWFTQNRTDPLTREPCSDTLIAQPHINDAIQQYTKVTRKRALQCYKDEDFTLAEQYFRQLCLLEPNNNSCHYNYARTLIKQDKIEDALQHITELSAEQKEQPLLRIVLNGCEGRLLMHKGLYDQAIQSHQNTIILLKNEKKHSQCEEYQKLITICQKEMAKSISEQLMSL